MDTPAATYPPSWVDRLLDWIDALPGPTWVLYTAVLLAIALATHAVAWAEGLARVGTFDPLLTSLAVYLVGSFAAIHYLDLAAARAWVSFRPATRLADVEAERVAYQLTTMPVRPTLGWTILGLVLAVVYSAGQYGQPLDLAGEPLTFGITAVAGLVSFAGAAVLIYHTLRQLRLIRRILDYVESIDLLQLEPLHAFAGVTATTGVYLLGFIYLSALTDPATFANPALLAFMIAAAGLAIASFVAPLYGIHVRIAAEKSRRLGAVNGRLDGGPARPSRRGPRPERGRRRQQAPLESARRARGHGPDPDLAVVAGDPPRLRHRDHPADRPLARVPLPRAVRGLSHRSAPLGVRPP